MKSIFAIKLLNDKFYVGSSYDVNRTLKYIFGNKSKRTWLVENKPFYVDKIIHDCDPNEEYNYLIKYIRMYGVENVRGPLFDSFTHERESLREINEKINKTQ